MACMIGRTNIVILLLCFPGTDPDIPNDDGGTALMKASFYRHTGCVTELMQWRKKQERRMEKEKMKVERAERERAKKEEKKEERTR